MFHRHVWVVRSVAPFINYRYFEGHRIEREVTKVLQVCVKCRKVRTQEISGTWTLDQIDPRTASERLAEELAHGS